MKPKYVLSPRQERVVDQALSEVLEYVDTAPDGREVYRYVNGHNDATVATAVDIPVASVARRRAKSFGLLYKAPKPIAPQKPKFEAFAKGALLDLLHAQERRMAKIEARMELFEAAQRAFPFTRA